jgi:hypothetical protein
VFLLCRPFSQAYDCHPDSNSTQEFDCPRQALWNLVLPTLESASQNWTDRPRRESWNLTLPMLVSLILNQSTREFCLNYLSSRLECEIPYLHKQEYGHRRQERVYDLHSWEYPWV